MIQVLAWERDAEDYNGRSQSEVFYVIVNGKEKAVGKGDLLRMIKMTLPERGVSDEEPMHEPRATSPESAASANGN